MLLLESFSRLLPVNVPLLAAEAPLWPSRRTGVAHEGEGGRPPSGNHLVPDTPTLPLDVDVVSCHFLYGKPCRIV